MSLDQRLKNGLQRDADGIVPNVEEPLARVMAGAHRRRRKRVVGSSLLALAALVAAIFVVPQAIEGIRSSSLLRPAGPPLPTAGPGTKEIFRLLSGTYTVNLSASENSVRANDLAGRWTITLRPDGRMDLSAPAAFRQAHGAAPTGNAFTVTAETFRTNALYNDFCSSVGTYRWSLSGQELTLSVVNDDCAIRRTLLSTLPLELSP